MVNDVGKKFLCFACGEGGDNLHVKRKNKAEKKGLENVFCPKEIGEEETITSFISASIGVASCQGGGEG